jgi:hypothetical protein
VTGDVWFRYVTLLVPQIVILIGMWFNRRPLRDLADKVESLDETMTRHLEAHVTLGRRK